MVLDLGGHLRRDVEKLPIGSAVGFAAETSLNILQVSTSDISGGAEKVAWNLFQSYRRRGYGSWLTVGYKYSGDSDVFQIRNDVAHDYWARLCDRASDVLSPLAGRVRGAKFLRNQLQRAARPSRVFDWWRGIEDFNFPGSWRVLDATPSRVDILHCHNLHTDYFDLRTLPWLSRQLPVFMTLHDAWLLSGHCAHSFDCERWKIGCGDCPDLTIYPRIRRDATNYNWRRKRDLFLDCSVHIATPSRWLMEKVEQSIVAPSIVDARVIPNGVDLAVFHPGDKRAAREELGLPQQSKLLLFTANGIRANIWKDYQTLRAAISRIAEESQGQRLLFIALGENGASERIGRAEICFVPYHRNPEDVARYYQAADVYVHAARADTFPLTILEALACGTPVVATAVGGIPEQIDDGLTGFLVPRADPRTLAARIEELLADDDLMRRIGGNAAAVARERFGLDRQTDQYLAWYKEANESWHIKGTASDRLSMRSGSR